MFVVIHIKKKKTFYVSQTKFGDLFFLSGSYSSSSSFLPLNLSGAFLEDGPKELNKTLGYDRPTYLVVHTCLSFYLGLANNIGGRGGGSKRGGLTLNPMGKILNSVVIGYNLKTVKDIDMKSSESYTECYRQYIHDVRYVPWGSTHPPGMGNC
jgi:hypothetical protein